MTLKKIKKNKTERFSGSATGRTDVVQSFVLHPTPKIYNVTIP